MTLREDSGLGQMLDWIYLIANQTLSNTFIFQIEVIRKMYDYILRKQIQSYVESILKVGNNADITKTFTIKKKMSVLIVMVGEAGYDYGWLEDSNGNILFDYDYQKNFARWWSF